jgi:hypothetical protein
VVPFEDSLLGDDVSLRPVTIGVEIVALTSDDELTKRDVEVSLLANNVDDGDSLLTLTIGLVAISLTFEPNALDVTKLEMDDVSNPDVELEKAVV